MTAAANPGRNWLTVRDTEYALRHGSANLGSLPGLIRELLETEAWRYFVLPSGEPVEHERFADFLAAKPAEGLETTERALRKIGDSIEDEAERAKFHNLLDRAMQGNHGGDRRSEDFNVSNIHVENPGKASRPVGTTQARAHRKLRKDAPELHAEVLAGRLSAHAAMVQAGFRPKTISVPVSRPESVARALRRHLGPDDLAALIRHLLEDQ